MTLTLRVRPVSAIECHVWLIKSSKGGANESLMDGAMTLDNAKLVAETLGVPVVWNEETERK